MADSIFNVTVVSWPGYEELQFPKYLAYMAQQLPHQTYVDFCLLGAGETQYGGPASQLAHGALAGPTEPFVKPASSQPAALTAWANKAAATFEASPAPRFVTVIMHGAAFSSTRLFQRDGEALAKLSKSAPVLYVVFDPKGSIFLQLNGIPPQYIVEASLDRMRQTCDVLVDKSRSGPLRVSDLDRVRCGGPGAAARSTIVSIG